MEVRPPVPPKDRAYSTQMAVEITPTAAGSGSKRKRQVDTSNNLSHDNTDDPDSYEHTPKRPRPHFAQSDASASEDNGTREPRLVRKKASRNLSNLNLRHAAKTQTLTQAQAQARGSRFQEGSLNDKPSEKPPSFFTRFTRGETKNPAHVDSLMEDYHDELPPARPMISRTESRAQHPTANSNVPTAKKDEPKGFFQFGRQLAANFRPVTLWKNIWSQSKDEVAREELEAEARKAKQKVEAEAKYAEMKQTGQLELQPIGTISNGARSSVEETSTPQDSAVALESLQSSLEPSRSTSAATVLRPLIDNGTDRPDTTVFESTTTLAKGLKERLPFNKPSLVNLKSDLRRMRSDMSLTGHRESSSSISPIKADFGLSALKKSTSRLDLKKSASKVDLKKQNKLSKRVSDLESKLAVARKELDEALVEASPMPKLSGKYERFTPSATITRPKFLPGKLPSLPSERVLMAEQGIHVDDNGEVADEAAPRRAMEMSLDELMDEQDEGEDTIKASRARSYPRRATSLFNLSNNDIQTTSPNKGAQEKTFQHFSAEATENMDPNSISDLTSEATPQQAKPVDYASLDAKLKALDANVKTARKAAKPKKRKSGAADEDKTFRPGKGKSDDDVEWEEATPKKKQRKNASSKNETSPPSKRGANPGQKRSPLGKGKGATVKTNGVKASSPNTKVAQEDSPNEQSYDEDFQSQQEEYSADETAEAPDFRASVDSQGVPLDPVYEEEEEVQTGTEEQIMTRAGRAAQVHPGRQNASRSASPPLMNGWIKTTTTTVDETIMVTPGEGGVPALPKGANGSFESLDVFGGDVSEVEVLRAGGGGGREGDEFEWPDDVF